MRHARWWYVITMPAVAASLLVSSALAEGMQVWPVDPLIKVFPDDSPGPSGQAIADVARGEHASLQVVVRADAAISDLSAALKPLTMKDGGAKLEPRVPRFVGYVPVDRPTQKPSKDQLRKPPADFPDPLLELDSIDVKAGRAQPVWLTVKVPVDARPGTYRGRLELGGKADGEQVSASCPLLVRVHGVTVKRTRLWVTNWFRNHSPHMAIEAKPYNDAYYDLLRRYARNMADHRQNVAIIRPLSLAEFGVGADGKLTIDFAHFDRWVTIFKEEGVLGLIEGGHIGGRKKGWDSQFVVTVFEVVDGKVRSRRVDPSDPVADAFYGQFFPALVKHLKAKGWLDIYTQHLADEPVKSNIKTYRGMAALARKYAPELPIIEACHTKDLTGAIDIWVPQLNFLHRDIEHYMQRQQAGDRVWFYTCVFPQGEYANRFIEQPLIKTRLLHWINYRYGLTGYLHWGYNFWTKDDPFTHLTRPHGGPPYLPAGDAWIVYPGKKGPLDSIRFEAMRDGIVDHELLSMLGERDAAAAKKLAAEFIIDFDEYNTDVKVFRAKRRALLERLSGK